MADYDESTYGERIAEVYDSLNESMRYDASAAVDFLAPLAKGRRVLELGIGTGRIALPLAQRGIRMHGVDASPAMVEKLRGKPGGAEIPVEMGNFANLKIGGRFSLVYVVFNTFFGIRTQDDQVRCFTPRRQAPDFRRRLRDRGVRSGPHALRSGGAAHLHCPDFGRRAL